MQNVGERVKELRLQKGLTVKDLSVKSGVKSALISRLEAGHIADPRLSLLRKICEGLGIEVLTLFQEPKISIPTADRSMDFRLDVPPIVGNSDFIKKAIEKMHLFSKLDDAILLTGETGTGKNLFAMHIHY